MLPPAPTEIRTNRLALRRWRATDLPLFAALNADPAVMEFMPKLLTRAESDAFVERISSSFDERAYGLWAVEVADSGAFVGFTGLSAALFEAPFTPAVEVGWRLARSSWGHGYATEAAHAALDDGFGRLGLEEIVSFTAVVNERSTAVMERLGMQRDIAGDFDHPALPVGDPLRLHVLYRLQRRLAASPEQ
ncbi:MAG: GNAT family N-acetyltransferase [Actinomycetota bacterium]